MIVNPERLFVDERISPNVPVADCNQLEFCPEEGVSLYGEIYFPSGSYEGLRPCVCLVHGFPGSVVNDDLAQALRRMGCIVVRLFQRGAWGSGGDYSFTHNIQDVAALVRWLERVGSRRYPIDKQRIFLTGHSVGGMTVLNAAGELPCLRGIILMAPMDMGYLVETEQWSRIQELLTLGRGILKEEYEGAWLEDLKENGAKYSFQNAVIPASAHPVMLISATLDTVAPPDEMVDPLWAQLQKNSAGLHTLVRFQAGHSFCSSRIMLTKRIGTWIAELCNQN